MFVRNGQRLGSVLVEETGTGPRPDEKPSKKAAEPKVEPKSEPVEEPAAAASEDGVHSVGGGWHEVVVGGEVVDKVRGAEAAQDAYEAHKSED